VAKPKVPQDANPDPITEEPGSHPIETGVGAALGGAAAGAAVGAVAGPIGTVAGAVVGGVAGGYAGKAAGEYFDPTREEAFWREHYKNRSYYEPGKDYDYYHPAYEYGWESSSRYRDRNFAAAATELERDWPNRRADSDLEWDDARPVVEDAWNRVRQPNAFDTTIDMKRPPR
jgi:hypothetical protein